MKTDYTTRSAEEAKTHELLDTYRDANWSPEKAILAQVFKAIWSSSISVERVNKIAIALNSMGESGDLQKTLTEAVRAKILRSRMHGGVRLYEVNY